MRSPAVAADEWGGWVWINLAGPDAAPPLIDAIGREIGAEARGCSIAAGALLSERP